MQGRPWFTLKGMGRPVADPGVLPTVTTSGAHVWGHQGEDWRGHDVGTRGLSEERCG